jgi:hypothetical protein
MPHTFAGQGAVAVAATLAAAPAPGSSPAGDWSDATFAEYVLTPDGLDGGVEAAGGGMLCDFSRLFAGDEL